MCTQYCTAVRYIRVQLKDGLLAVNRPAHEKRSVFTDCIVECQQATRGYAANVYAKAKDKSANKIINDKGLDIDFRAITFTTYGGFGTPTHALISKMTSEAYPCDFNPSRRPGPNI